MTQTPTAKSPFRITLPKRRGVTLFAASVDEPRSRRAGDVIVLVFSLIALILLSVVASPPAGIERAFISFVSSTPKAWDGFWRVFADAVGVAAIAIIVAAIVRRRVALVRDLVLAGVVAFVLSLVIARFVSGAWPDISDAFRTIRDANSSVTFPSLRTAIPNAIVLVGLPHLSQPARRLGRWLIAMGWLGVVALAATTPSGATAALLVALVSAAMVHLTFGSCWGRPTVADVAGALDGLDLGVHVLGAADRQPTGLFVVHAQDRDGNPLVVKVYGRDAHDTQLLNTLWRTVWLREAGAPTLAGRLQQAEHEAFLTLLARQSAVRTEEVVTAAATADNDVVLVLRTFGESLADAPQRWSASVVERAWAMLATLHDAGIAHGQVDDHRLFVDGDEVGVRDFRGATVGAGSERLRTDEAQLLVATVLGVGLEPALAAATAALGPEGLALALPLLQMTALTPEQRAEVKTAGLDLDEVRDRAAAAAGIEPPPLQQLRRVTIGSVLQVALLLFAFFVLVSAFGGLDWAQLADEVRGASWALIFVGFAIAQLPRLSQAVSMLGASPTPLPLGPVYLLQLAMSYIGLALPSTAARVAINIRFLQRYGLPAGSAVAIGALDGAAGFVVQASLLLGILLLTPTSLDLQLGSSAPSGLGTLVVVVVALGLVATIVLVSVGRWRRAIFERIHQFAIEGLAAARGLRSPRRLLLLFGGNLATELLWVSSLGAFALAFGYRIGITELLLINLSVSLLSGVMPIPGGIGVVEGGLAFGLVRAGMPEETAFAAVILFRLSSTYLPPIWGYFAFNWLRKNQRL